jgi:hypothetical protein
MAMENADQGHTTVDEEEVVVELNSGSYENPEDELGYLLQKRGARKGSDERDPDYIPEGEVW